MNQIYREKWDERYERYENYMNYPTERIIKFLNHFVRKRIGGDQFSDILLGIEGGGQALDFGCGVGQNTKLMQEFGLKSFGVDISGEAIETAQNLFPEIGDRFKIIEENNIPFDDHFFDISICEGVLDSMHFQLAQKIVEELDRVTSKLLFASLISGDDSEHYREFSEEIMVEQRHEVGTVQSYFNWQKVFELIAGTGFHVKWATLVTEESLLDRYKGGRYSVVFSK